MKRNIGKMRVEDLEVFKALYTSGSVASAAKMVGLGNQKSKAKDALDRVQAHYNVHQLFERVGSRKTYQLTEHGVRLIGIVDSFLISTQKFKIQEVGKPKREVNICGASAMVDVFFTPIFPKLREEFGSYASLNLRPDTSWDILDSIDSESIQVALVSQRYRGNKLKCEKIFDASLGLFVSKDWDNENNDPLQACSEYPLALYTGGNVRGGLLEALSTKDIFPNISISSTSSRLLADILKTDFMVALLPRFFETELPDYQILDLDDKEFNFLTVSCYCVYQDGDALVSEIAKFLLKEIRNVKLSDQIESSFKWSS